MRLEISNEQQAVTEAGVEVTRVLMTRLLAGLGAISRLPQPKDGGRALMRTGALYNGIDTKTAQDKRGRWTAITRAFGDRPAEERAEGKAKRARVKTREMRAAVAVALTLSRAISGTVYDSSLLRKAPSKSGDQFRLSRVKVRAATTNAALAAILSQPPQDVRGRNGGRALYRVFEPAEVYRDVAAGVFRRTLQATLVAEET